MKDLIKLWKRVSEKYNRIAKDTKNEIVVEGLLAQAEVYSICADQLERTIASNKPLKSENGAWRISS